MALSTLSRLQLTPDMNICRTLNGLWQVSGGHGHIDRTAAIKDMFHYMNAGFTTWDLADIYGPAEDIMGEFIRQLLSVRDRRPEMHMIQFCQQNNIKLFTYGTVCGGLLSDKYLGKAEPRSEDLTTVSLKKYKNMVDKWGGWQLFQELLTVLKQIANKYNVSITNVAVRYILDKPAVGGVIIGARLGLSEHLQDNTKVFEFNLDADDNEKIDEISRKSRDLYRTIGDCGDEYR
ncbi:unnamed protein product [Rotaria sp. Silwood2]|nr:unnamed protein product [Rotaria sp. Silwood2]